MQCPSCKGSKKITVTAITYGDPSKTQSLEIPCINCHGTGEISAEEHAQAQAHKDLWCYCEGQGNHETIYVPDGVSPVCRKHHWVCAECGKIVQIG